MAALIKGLRTKAARIRALAAAGFDRSQIANTLGLDYQHVYNVLSGMWRKWVRKLVDWGMSSAGLWRVILNPGLEVRAFDADRAVAAAALRAATRSRGLSLGDRACPALAQSAGLPVLTADRAWHGVGLDVEIEVIRT